MENLDAHLSSCRSLSCQRVGSWEQGHGQHNPNPPRDVWKIRHPAVLLGHYMEANHIEIP